MFKLMRDVWKQIGNLVLRSVKLLSRQTLDLLYKLTVRSVIDYALPVYCKSLKLSDLSRLETIQYKAAKLVTGASHLTNKAN